MSTPNETLKNRSRYRDPWVQHTAWNVVARDPKRCNRVEKDVEKDVELLLEHLKFEKSGCPDIVCNGDAGIYDQVLSVLTCRVPALTVCYSQDSTIVLSGRKQSCMISTLACMQRLSVMPSAFCFCIGAYAPGEICGFSRSGPNINRFDFN